VIDPRTQPPDQVRFGATVTLLTINGGIQGNERFFTIVGVDEASVAEGKVAFVAPIAKAVLGKRVGESFSLRMGPEEEIVKVTAITY
jgi:transcription elongation factor GreB